MPESTLILFAENSCEQCAEQGSSVDEKDGVGNGRHQRRGDVAPQGQADAHSSQDHGGAQAGAAEQPGLPGEDEDKNEPE